MTGLLLVDLDVIFGDVTSALKMTPASKLPDFLPAVDAEDALAATRSCHAMNRRGCVWSAPPTPS